MFELSVERVFCAAHAIEVDGEREPIHGHNWRVRVAVEGPKLDADGLLCDFHAIETALDRVLEPFRDRELNRVPPFDRINPTAEQVARHVAGALQPVLPAGVRLESVRVTEAPGCTATFRSDE